MQYEFCADIRYALSMYIHYICQNCEEYCIPQCNARGKLAKVEAFLLKCSKLYPLVYWMSRNSQSDYSSARALAFFVCNLHQRVIDWSVGGLWLCHLRLRFSPPLKPRIGLFLARFWLETKGLLFLGPFCMRRRPFRAQRETLIMSCPVFFVTRPVGVTSVKWHICRTEGMSGLSWYGSRLERPNPSCEQMTEDFITSLNQ